ncbi:hypothetical protein [Pontibacter cellulosilyticus]|uniref:Uncharacterized protein n=1 Tax=Pontibacter cellulosilyticus TaxID=1720253 RepID=A0A923NA01_9BACT|nr:hypothetical protein [Pontibacter cellulosilyticus]MBC5994542.1 hypothetical protein [Pontibacter cellulosilyticus]
MDNENKPNKLEASLLLDFNYPVLFQELQKHLQVYAGNKELPIKLTSGNRDNITIY